MKKTIANQYQSKKNFKGKYKPKLVESVFETNYKYYESRGDKNKALSVKQYDYAIFTRYDHK